MKKIATVILALTITFLSVIHAFSAESPESFMGFSVSEDWLVFSKDMTDKALLKEVDLTKKEVNEILQNADCEYFLANPEQDQKIYVKIEKNSFSFDLYNIFDADDEYLAENTDKILKECFAVDNFNYDKENILIEKNDQMKLIKITGNVLIDGQKHGMIIGVTFVNGNGIAFIMETKGITPEGKDISAFSEITNSVLFTVIKDKGSNAAYEDEQAVRSQTALSYISGGLGAICLVAICLYFIDRIKKTEKTDDTQQVD